MIQEASSDGKAVSKYSDHRCVRHQFLACRDTQQIRRIVKRSQLYTLFQRFDHKIVDEH